MSCVLSIDAGTESVRVAAIDRDGSVRSTAASAYETHYPANGWAEQEPDDWWHALGRAVGDCVESGPVGRGEIEGICLDATTCTLVALDASGAPLRPALLWMDVRAAAEATRIFETGHPAMQYCPSGCSAEWMLSKTLWMAEHEPEAYGRTHRYLDYADWLIWRLTGTEALNLNTASQRWFYHNRDWGFPDDLYRDLGLADLPSKMPERVIPCGALVGGLEDDAAEHLGLRSGIPVFEGGGDAFVAALGLGITGAGSVGMIAGSSNVFVVQTAEEVHASGLYGGFPDALVDSLWLVEAGQASAGSILAWFKRNFLADLSDEEAYAVMDAAAEKVPPGSGGVVVLDHFQGNRSPYSDSSSRGAIWGLSLATGRAEVFRALMEGIACGAEHIRRTFETAGIDARELIACGGATKSDVYMQIVADVTGVPIRIPAVSDAPLVGGAILAAVGVGWYHSLDEASAAMVHPGRELTPHEARHAAYRDIVARHEASYHRLRGLNA